MRLSPCPIDEIERVMCVCVLEAWLVKLSQVVYRMKTHTEDTHSPRDGLGLPRCLLEEPDATAFLMVSHPDRGSYGRRAAWRIRIKNLRRRIRKAPFQKDGSFQNFVSASFGPLDTLILIMWNPQKSTPCSKNPRWPWSIGFRGPGKFRVQGCWEFVCNLLHLGGHIQFAVQRVP